MLKPWLKTVIFTSALIAAVVVMTCLELTAQTPTPLPDPSPDNEKEDVIKVSTELVQVPVTVTDRNGKPIGNLKKENFIVFEDGKSQDISEFSSINVPFEIVLLLDTSGSARDELDAIRNSARVFINSLRPGDKLAIVAYATKTVGSERLAATEVVAPLSDNRSLLASALSRIGTSNGTPFYDSLIFSAQNVFPDAKEQTVKRRALVALTDGVDSTSKTDFLAARTVIFNKAITSFVIRVNSRPFFEDNLLGDCSTAIRFSQAQIKRYYDSITSSSRLERVFDICKMGDFERLDISKRLYEIADAEIEHLTKVSGGKVFATETLADSKPAFDQVADSIGKIYTVGYYSNNYDSRKKFRTITVKLNGLDGDYIIRSREGYTVKPE